jgi:hypothetical protein
MERGNDRCDIPGKLSELPNAFDTFYFCTANFFYKDFEL